MKHIILVLFIVITSFQALAQEKTSKKSEKIDSDEVIFIITEQQPSFPGDKWGNFDSLYKFLNAHIRYPAGDTLGNSETKVRVNIAVMKTGKIGKIEFPKPTQQVFKDEAIRVIRMMPDWIPAKNNGQAVNCFFNIPILFKK